jgi:hypothetical protein
LPHLRLSGPFGGEGPTLELTHIRDDVEPFREAALDLLGHSLSDEVLGRIDRELDELESRYEPLDLGDADQTDRITLG